MKILASRLFLFVLLLSLGTTVRAPADPPGPHGVWIGQDGHDYVGPSSRPGPSDVQDIHVRLLALPPDEEITSASVDRLGGGQWLYHGGWGPWAAHLERAPRSETADLYLEPSHENTPALHVTLHFAGGKTSEFDMSGGPADVNLRMPNAALAAQWVGQDGQDFTGSGPAVGPDGRQDVHLALSRLSAHIPMKSLTVTTSGPVAWQYGLNPERNWNAEVVPHAEDPSQADLFFSPDRDLSGQTLTLKIVYANDKLDQATVTALACDPVKTMPPPPPAPVLRPNAIKARWLGQNGAAGADRGNIHVVLAHLPASPLIVGAALSDPTGGYWTQPHAPDTLPLTFLPAPDGRSAALFFPPFRDEADATLTLRLTFADGTMTLVQFPGGRCDPLAQGLLPAPTSALAHPGDDLQAMAAQFGVLTLAPGTYPLHHPLILDAPITIRGMPGAVLLFSQSADDPAPWNTAVEIHRSNTTLAGFAIHFAGPIRWSADGNPAIIGAARAGQGAGDPRVNIVIARMDLEGPPVPGPVPPGKLVSSPFLMRLGDAASGRISGNRLRGGTTDVTGGPWQITDNTYDGAVPGTMAWDTFGGHYLHDLVVARNTLSPLPGSGKTWRFLVLTQWGMRDRVVDNKVQGIGIRDGDGVPNPNAPELFLTEAYRLHYEGQARWISAGGRILQIPSVMDGAVRPGTVAAILTGPHAGEWFRVAQAITPTTFAMERPLPPGAYAISLATGFVEDTYARNRIDNRGGSSVPLDLAGTHFGTRILDNYLLGGEGMLLSVMPTERPNLWGWSHVPFLGVLIANNLVEDARGGLKLDAEDNQYNKTTANRVYLRATVQNNAIRWTKSFLQLRQQGSPKPLSAFRLGDRSKLDPDEFILTVSGNTLQAPPGFRPGPTLWIKAATVNGKERRDTRLSLPVLPLPPTPARRQAVSVQEKATPMANETIMAKRKPHDLGSP